jgi:hypothetical protein
MKLTWHTEQFYYLNFAILRKFFTNPAPYALGCGGEIFRPSMDSTNAEQLKTEADHTENIKNLATSCQKLGTALGALNRELQKWHLCAGSK